MRVRHDLADHRDEIDPPLTPLGQKRIVLDLVGGHQHAQHLVPLGTVLLVLHHIGKALAQSKVVRRRAGAAGAGAIPPAKPAAISSKTPAIVARLSTQCRLATEDQDRKGCLIVDTVAERHAHSPESRAMAWARLEEITDFFRHHLTRARSPQVEARDAARTGTGVAIITLARAGATVDMIKAVTKQAFQAYCDECPAPEAPVLPAA